MNLPDSTLPWDELLAHGRFVRSLARSLVRDPARADDVAQASWLAVARHPRSGIASLRGWLASVVRNVARQEQRGERRREAREVVAAQSEGSVAASDVAVAELETQALLLAAVQALDPKYRAVVTLRFYEELPPRAIAARLALPVATVNTQLQRALEQLRAALDAKSDGARERWLRALAPAALEATVSVPGLVLAAAVVLLLIGGVWWRITALPSEGAEAAVVATSGGDGGHDAALQAALPGVVASLRVAPAPLSNEARIVTGRVVDAAGQPIEGATVELQERPDAPASGGATRLATTAADGSYAFDAVAAGRYELVARETGLTRVRRRVEIDVRSPFDRGATLVLFPARAVTGRVVDTAGEPIAGAQLLAFDETLFDRFAWPETVSGGDGRFTLDGVPTCRVWLTVVAHGHAKQLVGPVAAGSAAVAEFGDVTLVAEPPATLDLRVMDVAGQPLGDARLGYTLEGKEHTEFSYFRMASALKSLAIPADGHLVTDALPSGRYQFQVWSPTSRFDSIRFDAALAPGVTTLREQRASFTRGAVQFHGTLHDASGAPLAGRVLAFAPAAWSEPFLVTTAADGSFEAAAPVAAGRSFAVWLEHSGDGEGEAAGVGEVLLGAAAPSAVVEVLCSPSVPLALVATRAAALRGRVVHDDGTPAVGARLVLEPLGATIGDGAAESSPCEATTDLDGTFEFRNLVPGEPAVRLRVACGGLGAFVTLPDHHELAAGATIEGLRLVLPRLASIAGRVVDGAERPIAGAIVTCRRGSDPLRTVSAADGSFRFERVAAGACELELADRTVNSSMSFGTAPTWPMALALQLAPGEARVEVTLVDRSAGGTGTVHGTIELPPPPFDCKGGQLGVALRSATGSGSKFSPSPEFRFEGVNDPDARLVALFAAPDAAHGPAAWTVLFGPEVAAAPGGAARSVPLPAPFDSTVQLRFVDARGEPSLRPIGLMVEAVAPTDGNEPWSSASVWLDRVVDSLSIRGLAPGRYRIRLPPTVLRDFTVTATGLLDLGVVELARPPRLEGMVTDASGAPFAGARIGFARDLVFHPYQTRSGDPLDPDQPIVTLDESGEFSVEFAPDRGLIAWAEGHAPRWVPTDPAQLREQPIVLLPAGSFELSGFPRELENSDEWRFALVSLESEEARCGYATEFGRMSGTLPESYGCYAIPAGLYAACFWKGPAGRGSSDEPLPEQTVPHEAYRWTVTVKAGETTTIDLSREW
ncbi:MAG: sigma-70 family RNA polymerase sigma factor [Planctomycetes bacterium]|nr:sigma-70 family RNA polymerase sigma factor [Planctomycetota bacterium]